MGQLINEPEMYKNFELARKFNFQYDSLGNMGIAITVTIIILNCCQFAAWPDAKHVSCPELTC